MYLVDFDRRQPEDWPGTVSNTGEARRRKSTVIRQVKPFLAIVMEVLARAPSNVLGLKCRQRKNLCI